MKQQSK